MLNIGRMGPGSEDYYLSLTVDRAGDAGDYYLSRGEAPGRWLGRGIGAIGLDGEVDGEQLKAVLAGDDPVSGERLASHPARKVPGFDLTFRAPKSVSLLWALTGDRQVADAVVAAHEAAVDAAVGYLEREAVRSRRGAGGTERVTVDGLVAAAFAHRTSRAGDPLLHTHVLAVNLARTCDDGKWRTLESRRIFLHAKTAGYLYQAQLRHELTARLGVAWGPVTNGYADLAGIDRTLIDAFSERRRQIVERLAERGETSAKAAQVATLETRTPKGVQPTETELRAGWADRARELGYDPRQIAGLLGRHRAREPDLDALVVELVDREALTEHVSTFARRDLLQAVAGRLPDGATVAEVEALADAVVEVGRDRLVGLGARRGQLTAVDAIRTADGRIVACDETEPRMTTRRLLLAERHTITTALTRQREGVAVVDSATVEQVLAARPSMTGEQARMLRRLTTDGDGVTVVVGRAGTGKTFTLDAARDAWTRAGIDVTGVALAARAARELQDASGIPSTTIHRLLHQVDAGVGSPLRPGSVLVVDEAGMVGTRQLARLLQHAQVQRVKVVLVGDSRQLPEIDAGGLFGHLARRLDPVELTDNRRQTARWEVDALDRLRHGDPADALHLYESHGRVVTADTAEALREQLVSDWWHARHQVGAHEAVMIALRRADVDDLNTRARQRLHTAGLLTGPTYETDGTGFQAGDRILCLRNDRRLGVVNGTFAQVVAVAGDGLLVAGDDGQHLRLPPAYVEAGHVTYGYAITGHKAQGLTVDRAFVLGSDQLYREWGYVALSRGRESNRLYVHAGAVDPHGITHSHQHEVDPHTQTLAGLRRSAAQTPAVAFTIADLDPADARELAAARRLLTRRLTGVHDRRRELTDRERHLTGAVARVTETIERLTARRDELGGLARVRRSARDEIADIDRQLAGCRWSLTTDRQQLDDTRRSLAVLPADRQIAAWQHELAELDERIVAIAEARTRAALHDPPGHLLRTIGRPPPAGSPWTRWAETVRTVETYRLTYGVTDPHQPLGPPAIDPDQTRARRQAATELLALAPHAELERAPVRQRTLGRGLSR